MCVLLHGVVYAGCCGSNVCGSCWLIGDRCSSHFAGAPTACDAVPTLTLTQCQVPALTPSLTLTQVSNSKLAERDQREHLNLVFIGHVDAGKSTFCGQILYRTGQACNQQPRARALEAARVLYVYFMYKRSCGCWGRAPMRSQHPNKFLQLSIQSMLRCVYRPASQRESLASWS